MAADSSELAPDFAELPPELWHKIAYDFAGLKAADIAALRQASPRRLAREVFTAAGRDRVLWESAAGVRWCRDNDRPAALVVCLRRTGINPNYYRLLAWAVEKDHAEVVSHLLADPRIDLNLAGNFSNALHLAVCKGSAGSVKLLLADGRIDPTSHDFHCVKKASCLGDIATLRLLLTDARVSEAGARPIEQALSHAVRYGQSETIWMLFEETDANINSVDFGPLGGGASRIGIKENPLPRALGYWTVMNWAEQHNADVSGPMFTIAVKSGHMGVFRLGLAGGNLTAAELRKGLCCAALRNDLEMVSALLDAFDLHPPQPQSIVFSPNDSPLPLVCAAWTGAAEALSMILEDGRFADSPTEALREATKMLRLEIVKILLADGRADPAPALEQAREIESDAVEEAETPKHSNGLRPKGQTQEQQVEAAKAWARARAKKAAAIFDLIAKDPRLTL
jgi:hypothetical protein